MDYRKPSKSVRNKDYLQRGKGPAEKGAYAAQQIREACPFLIVCEGANTERLYFENFRLKTPQTILVKGGYPGGKMYLVDEALKLKHSESGDFRNHAIWCVFDYDVDPCKPSQREDFNNAIRKAQQNDMQVAFSNDAFELWMVLHFQLVETALLRDGYYDILDLSPLRQEHGYRSVGKQRQFCEMLYERLLPYQSKAIRHAIHLHEKALETAATHADMNPCTTVHLLVQELNKYLKE